MHRKTTADIGRSLGIEFPKITPADEQKEAEQEIQQKEPQKTVIETGRPSSKAIPIPVTPNNKNKGRCQLVFDFSEPAHLRTERERLLNRLGYYADKKKLNSQKEKDIKEDECIFDMSPPTAPSRGIK